uniref:Uncharacterized protein n=1 Tax=Fagus sylvatica TaxID=28930 RepID=A0A2N9HHK6_FAGSY
MAKQPHVLVISFPAQGHVAPLMKLSHLIVDHRINVIFVTSEFIHAKVTATMPVKNKASHFKDLIEKINQSNDDEQISCTLLMQPFGWALEEVAEKMGIKRAAVWLAGAGNLAFTTLHILKLIEDGNNRC